MGPWPYTPGFTVVSIFVACLTSRVNWFNNPGVPMAKSALPRQAQAEVQMPPRTFALCVECDNAFPADELLYIHPVPVCARCTPIFLQRLIEGAALPGYRFWRSGRKLVARLDASFPDRCVRCNGPAKDFRLKRDFFFTFGPHKRALIHIGLCQKHRARHKLGAIIGAGSVALGLILLLGGAAIGSGSIAFAGIAVLLVLGLIAAILSTTVTPSKIATEHIWLNGVHRDFLDGLPEWPGSP